MLCSYKSNPISIEGKSHPSFRLGGKKLSLAQKFSAGSLGKFGYELLFIRNEKGRSIAILSNHADTVSITEDGEINGSPEITIR